MTSASCFGTCRVRSELPHILPQTRAGPFDQRAHDIVGLQDLSCEAGTTRVLPKHCGFAGSGWWADLPVLQKFYARSSTRANLHMHSEVLPGQVRKAY